jgi:RimJ/RimL family protein N-acetyltransferase
MRFTHGGIVLRKLEESDLDLLLELKRESWPYTHHTTIANRSDQQRWFQSLSGNVHAPESVVLSAGVAEEKDPTAFGIFKCFGVDYINRNAQVGWDVFASHRGNGLGRRIVSAGAAFCFEILNLRRLTAEILADNERSRRCAEGCGFRKEGCHREAVYRNGRYVDSLIFGLLRSDVPAKPEDLQS